MGPGGIPPLQKYFLPQTGDRKMMTAVRRAVLPVLAAWILTLGLVSNAQAVSTKAPPAAGYTLQEKLNALKGLATVLKTVPLQDIVKLVTQANFSINFKTGMLEVTLHGEIMGIPLEGISLAIGSNRNLFNPAAVIVVMMDQFTVPGDLVGSPGTNISIDGNLNMLIPLNYQAIVKFLKYAYITLKLNTDSMAISIPNLGDVVIGMRNVALTMDLIQMKLVPFTYAAVDCSDLSNGPSSGEIAINLLTGGEYIPFSQCLLLQLNGLIGTM
jgi:hypothetical protein